MRTLFRLALIAAAAQFTVACTSSMSAMNPFDGDPNGPPPAPHMWEGAYAGDEEAPVERVAREDTKRATPVRETRVASADPDDDRSYGTNDVESSELPPPSADRSYDEPAPRDDPAPREESRASRDDGETRTLTTMRPGEHAVEARPAPAARTVTHTVGRGEELSDIADNYGVREVDIIALNSLRPPYALKKGQELKIPARETAAAPSEGDYVKAGDVAVPRSKPEIDGGRAAEAEPAAKPSKQAAAEGPRFDWPVSGKVISNFGASGDGLYNEGINIAVPVGTPVRAAAAGTIRYAGNELRGYGNLVLIEHSGGYVTAYAHNDSLKVKRGDKVSRGDVIALSGKTGNVKSPQLHFEVRKGTESVDPRKHLVAKAS